MLFKRLAAVVLLLAAAALDVLFYRQAALVESTAAVADPAARRALLESDDFPAILDDELEHARGRALLEIGADSLAFPEERDPLFRAAHKAVLRSLLLNPLSAGAHVDLAQILEYGRLLDLPFAGRDIDEYLRAARLAGQNPDVFDKAGGVLLSRWDSLRPEEKRFTQDILKSYFKTRPSEEKLDTFLDVWALHVRDYAVLKAILPDNPASLRRLARFLAERSLDRSVRIHNLAQAESLEFGRAREALAEGQSDFRASRFREAEAHFRSGLALAKGIRFYQTLDGRAAIDATEFRDLLRSLLLGIARSRIETVQAPGEAFDDLNAYLEVEDSAGSVGEVEKSLRERRLIGTSLDAGGKDLRLLAFEMAMAFRQNRFREITEAGRALEAGVLLVPESSRRDYATVLEIIGDAYSKLDYLYESNAFYQKAHDTGASGIGLLLKWRKNEERLNDAERMKAIDAEIGRLVPAGDIDWSGIVVPKGTDFTQTLILEGGEISLTVRVETADEDPPPYVAVYFNGPVFWEDFVRDGVIRLRLPASAGANKLEIVPLNKPLNLLKLEKGESRVQAPAQGRVGRKPSSSS